ncbi:glycine cleavage system protein GcvH [Bacteriovorax sp. Seq25_V]|uniref:glycine cleavage system protein GcvH n=1 Tax=Bacteriovorax sp. Seq25_V TaxID=1201288 RepID=UPI000389F48C|nr:glycine cleavage system protein GcvH [Bacteriovorax sp. Seq25_V]EQC43243.1 glycine cleavage system H protein [Bacteriovorax sp. Seq25_V]
MANIPSNLKYTKEHEWASLNDGIVTVGITDFAQSSLGDIVFVELPAVGDDLDKDATFGVVESIKSASDLYSPVSGEVVEINEALVDSPDMLNATPYDSWMVKIKVSSSSEFDELLSDQDYAPLCEE